MQLFLLVEGNATWPEINFGADISDEEAKEKYGADLVLDSVAFPTDKDFSEWEDKS